MCIPECTYKTASGTEFRFHPLMEGKMFVRWLGAFGRCQDVSASAEWELTQNAREVAAEPLFRGRSLILAENSRVFVGIVADEKESEFKRGFFSDCWSKTASDGTLAPKHKIRPIRDQDRFRRAWSKSVPTHHGEAFFDHFTAKAVAVRKDASPQKINVARDLAKTLGLPLHLVEEFKM